MKTQCPNCKQHYEVDDSFLGATVSCETCKKEFVVENKETEINYLDNSPKTSKKAFVLMGLIFVLLLFICVFFIANLSNKVNDLTAQNTELQIEIKGLNQENSELKNKIDDLVFGPEAMLLNALAAYNTSDIDRANKIIVELFQKYPGKRMNKEYTNAFDKISLAFENMQKEKKKEEEKRQAEKAKKEAEMLTMIEKKYDFMQGITWYETTRNTKIDKYTSPFFDNPSDVYYDIKLYCGKSDRGNKLLRLKVYYSGESWVFIEQLLLKNIEGKEVKYDIKRDRESEIYSGSVLEWADISVSSSTSDIKAVLESDTVFIRLSGKYIRDWEMTEEQKLAFMEILDFYNSLD